MEENNYLSLVDLAKSLNKKASKLEKGKLSLDELSKMLENSRDIYERLTVLRYKALLDKKEITEEFIAEKVSSQKQIQEKVEESSFLFQFDIENEESLNISPNQKNLIDEINEIGSDSTFTSKEESSLNEKYAATSDKPESLAEKLTKSKINDLKEGIALNQKFLFINDLFGGDKSEYDMVLSKLNNCETILEAKAYLSSELETKHNWNDESPVVQQFISLLERKF
jgi:hypothetical protein